MFTLTHSELTSLVNEKINTLFLLHEYSLEKRVHYDYIQYLLISPTDQQLTAITLRTPARRKRINISTEQIQKSILEQLEELDESKELEEEELGEEKEYKSSAEESCDEEEIEWNIQYTANKVKQNREYIECDKECNNGSIADEFISLGDDWQEPEEEYSDEEENIEQISPSKHYSSINISKRNRDKYAKELYEEFNRKIFKNRLPADLRIVWSNQLRSTAGRCVSSLREGEPHAKIELSIKVITDLHRLRSTLIHELCHAACAIIDKNIAAHHGKIFKRWGRKAEDVYPDITVSTCHNYIIHYKYRYQCSNELCAIIIGRHSKSIDPSKHVCGRCNNRLIELGPVMNSNGISTPAGNNKSQRKLNDFAQYVQNNYSVCKKSNSSLKHAELMKILAAHYKRNKPKSESAAAGTGENESLIQKFEAIQLN